MLSHFTKDILYLLIFSRKTTQHQNGHHSVDEHETKVKETGSARRNITRKKSDLYDNKNKKQGGAG